MYTIIATFYLLEQFQQPYHPKRHAEEQSHDGQAAEFHISILQSNSLLMLKYTHKPDKNAAKTGRENIKKASRSPLMPRFLCPVE
jgi:hypothetical protein